MDDLQPSAGQGPAVQNPSVPAQTHLELSVTGMTCAACVNRVERTLGRLEGVQDARVNLATGRAAFEYDPARLPLGTVLERLEGAGYPALTSSVELSVTGMTCAACVGRVERALKGVQGVLSADVNLATHRGAVRFVPGAVGLAEMRAALEKAGYALVSEQPGQTREQAENAALERERFALRRDLTVAAVFAVPLFLIAMLPMLFPALMDLQMRLMPMQAWNLTMLALATPVQFGPGGRFARAGVRALRAGSPDMNTLVLLGTGAAYLYSLLVTLAPGLFPAGTAHPYFESAAVVIALVLLGKHLETVQRGRSSEAIRALMRLQPQTVRALRGGEWRELPLSEVLVGDALEVRPGERIPTDAVVVRGSSWVDLSLMTGESAPVRREAGDEVVGGALNGAGALELRAVRVGGDTALAGIVRLVEGAQADRLPVQALADRVVARFVPVVLGLAVLTFAVWLLAGGENALERALSCAVSVLIIACPCAMGLATPVSLLVGSGKGAELGLLFRRGSALERLSRVKTVALDKTGTLTQGKARVTDVLLAPYAPQSLGGAPMPEGRRQNAEDALVAEQGALEAKVQTLEQTARAFAEPSALSLLPSARREAALLALAASLERSSEHPLARAIVEAALERGLPLSEAEGVQALPGLGLEGTVSGVRVHIGSAHHLTSLDIEVGPLALEADRLSSEGKTPVFVAVDGRLEALFAVADPLREGAREAVVALENLGLRPVMLSGDLERTARAVGAQLGLEDVRAGLLPGGKVEVVKALGASGAVAFVGDGLNDAPALAQADVGLALGTGTDVAQASAEVLLVSGDPRGVPRAVQLSRAVIGNIRLGLFWAFAYNALLIPVAAGALFPLTGWLLSPVLAGAAMGISSVFVLWNALRLRGFRPTV